MTALAVGALASAAPAEEPVALALLGGSQARLDEFRGKVVLLNFWATWCAPCRGELSDIDRLVGEHRGALVAIAVLAEPRPDRRLLAQQVARLRLPVATGFVRGGGRFPLANNAVPTTYILDRDGRIVLVRAGAFASGELAARLKPLLDPKGR